MDDFLDTFNRWREHNPAMELGHNFEERVFAKIKRKKTQRKVIASVTLGAVFIGAIFIAQATLFHSAPKPQPPVFAQTQTTHHEKEEVPVVEDVVFASSDARSSYVIEQVGYTPNNNTL